MSRLARNDPIDFIHWLERQDKRADSIGALARSWLQQSAPHKGISLTEIQRLWPTFIAEIDNAPEGGRIIADRFRRSRPVGHIQHVLFVELQTDGEVSLMACEDDQTVLLEALMVVCGLTICPVTKFQFVSEHTWGLSQVVPPSPQQIRRAAVETLARSTAD